MKVNFKRLDNKTMYELGRKPIRTNDQVSIIWDILANHLPHCLYDINHKIWWTNLKLNFILGFMALIVGLLGVIIARGG